VRASIWRLNPLVALNWREWGDEWILFEGGSGSTHKMNGFGAAVLQALSVRGGAASAGSICDRVALQLGLPNDSVLAESIKAQLAYFQRADLVEPVSE